MYVCIGGIHTVEYCVNSTIDPCIQAYSLICVPFSFFNTSNNFACT